MGPAWHRLTSAKRSPRTANWILIHGLSRCPLSILSMQTCSATVVHGSYPVVNIFTWLDSMVQAKSVHFLAFWFSLNYLYQLHGTSRRPFSRHLHLIYTVPMSRLGAWRTPTDRVIDVYTVELYLTRKRTLRALLVLVAVQSLIL
ncbi:hypothetical protein NEOLEDRAFT_275580 [Neolentinus lepideus HHB14362 ss-1]|uniref:Uncharacterized protein n=1 Tax=Neolentinus lepideus HHB14362 ss-1 TaxID=1314782 RepID=A0A165T5W1_9AGAM|nr:hypothetical protein NEOLEDRAFT_275580 [Neolentinus lepideus HHB14362 ss-1]